MAALQEKSGTGKIGGYAADVSDSQQVEKLFQAAEEALGGLDILINNAGIGTFRATAELSVAEWDRLLGVNLSGRFIAAGRRLFALSRREAVGSLISAAWRGKIRLRGRPRTMPRSLG
jgi:NAD(P)-dependent dehydrogenase (short-subunit alcohol dehydrogenase family)